MNGRVTEILQRCQGQLTCLRQIVLHQRRANSDFVQHAGSFVDAIEHALQLFEVAAVKGRFSRALIELKEYRFVGVVSCQRQAAAAEFVGGSEGTLPQHLARGQEVAVRYSRPFFFRQRNGIGGGVGMLGDLHQGGGRRLGSPP